MKVLLLLLVSGVSGLCADSCHLIVQTLTGDGKDDGTNAGVYLRINDLKTKHPLDDPKKNDRQAGAENVYPGILLDVKPEDIETLTLEIDGEDAWFLKRISFRVVCGDASSEELVFRRRDWLSTAKESVYARDSVKYTIDGKLALDDSGN
ncbi:MAG: PLAT/LH2 domain-containing protein [Akkermansiaceae bacterium]